MDLAFATGEADDDGRAELRGDLKDARGLEGTDRRDALKGIREDARDGKYGDRIERHAERRATTGPRSSHSSPTSCRPT